MTVKPPGHGKASLSGAHVGSGRCLKRNEPGTHMSLVVGTFTIGFILSLLALGVFISFRIFAFPDITADGSITLGAAVAATLLAPGVNPALASPARFGAGLLARTCTCT